MELWGLLGGMAMVVVIGLVLHASRTNEVLVADARRALHRPLTWIVGVPALAVTFLVGAPVLYLTTTAPGATTTAPPATAKSSGPAATAAASGPAVPSEVAGSWAVGKGTQARYKVDDTVMGQTEEVVGTTPDVTGTMTIVDKTVTAVKIVVNMQTVACKCQHDSKYHDMLDTDVYPTSTFELTKPIELASIPPEGQVINVPVTGNFTIHGVTRQVDFTLAALRQGGRIAVNGSIPVRFEDYNIENPSGPFAGLSDCKIEFLVAFDRA
jgi:polyisoprenoid-binding protein YceI